MASRSADPTKSRTSSASSKCATRGALDETAPRSRGSSSAARSRRSAAERGAVRTTVVRSPGAASLADVVGCALHRIDRAFEAVLRTLAPGEETMAGEHDALERGPLGGQVAQPETEVEARALPRQPAERVPVHLLHELLALARSREGDHVVGVDVVDVRKRQVRMQRSVDAGGPAVARDHAVVEERHHRVLVVGAAVQRFEREDPFEVQHREAVDPDRSEVAARALDGQHATHCARYRVRQLELRRRVSPAVVRDPWVAAEQVRAQDEAVELGALDPGRPAVERPRSFVRHSVPAPRPSQKSHWCASAKARVSREPVVSSERR